MPQAPWVEWFQSLLCFRFDDAPTGAPLVQVDSIHIHAVYATTNIFTQPSFDPSNIRRWASESVCLFIIQIMCLHYSLKPTLSAYLCHIHLGSANKLDGLQTKAVAIESTLGGTN